MEKDFAMWHPIKESLHKEAKTVFFREREVWWCCLGVNIGYEQDGKDKDCSRPVLILKQFNLDVFWGLPLTSTTGKKGRAGKYYHDYKETDGISGGSAILSQLRLLDAKRLIRKMGMMDSEDYEEIKKKVVKLI